MRPHQNNIRILVRQKDKVEDSRKTDCIYKIPRRSCSPTYIDETVRTFGTRLEEHKKEVENITTRQFTLEQNRGSAMVEHKSAITDHADRNNCIIDWEESKVIDRESNINTTRNKTNLSFTNTTATSACQGQMQY